MNDMLPPTQPPTPTPLPPLNLPPPSVHPSRLRNWQFWVALIAGAIIAIAVIATVWFLSMLRPVDHTSTKKQMVTIVAGSTTADVGKLLADKHLVRSGFVYLLYSRLHRAEPKAGIYQLSPSESTSNIADRLTGGRQDTFEVTFYPGATLYDPAVDADLSAHPNATDVYAVLRRAGYSDQAVKEALSASYQSPLLADKPAGTSLEGYVYGETYQFDVGTSAKEVVQRSLDTFWQALSSRDLVSQLNAQGLTLYQGITLASIVEQEAKTDSDRAQVAQVFFSRLQQGMSLGSDVTFIYAAKQQGVTPDPSIDSPYNTRLHPGLPPGPISVPSLSSLEAVANPAAGDYLYFIAGDDGKVYFSHTSDEQDQNIAAHCQKLCS